MWAQPIVEKDFYFLSLIDLLSPLWSLSLLLLPISFTLIFLSLTLFLSRPHSTLPTSSRCCAVDVAWSCRPPILPRAADLSSLHTSPISLSLSFSLSLSLSLVVVAMFLMVVGCFDC